MTINERIKVLRNELNLTQTEFADRLGLSQNAIARYESGDRNPGGQTIKSICREFNVNVLWLENGEGEMFLPEPEGLLDELAVQYNLNDTEIKILQNYLELSEKDRTTFIELMKKMFNI